MDSGATRISWPRLALVSAVIAAVLVGGWAALRPISSAGATSQSIFAPYVDVTNTPMMHFEVPKDAAGEDVILAFVVADDKGDQPCRPSWGGYFPLPAAAEELDLDRRIEQLRHSGGDITVSFGGLTNRELATACQDPQQLDAAYTEVIDRYSLTSIDLDIEGDNLTDAAARTRRAEAIRRVQQAQEAKDQRLTVWLTLPVSTNGLTDDGFAQVQAFLEAGVRVVGGERYDHELRRHP